MQLEPEVAAPSQQPAKIIVDHKFNKQIDYIVFHKDRMLSATYSRQNYDQYIQHLQSHDVLEKHKGIIGIRKILSEPEGAMEIAQQIIAKSHLQLVLESAKQNQYKQMKLQAAWALTNILSGTNEQCTAVIQKGGIQIFISLMKENQPGIVDQAIWGLGNLASDSPQHRDQIVKEGGFRQMVKVIEASSNQKFIQTGIWALSNFCRGKGQLPKEQYQLAFPLLCTVLKNKVISDSQTVSDCLWALSNVSGIYNNFFLRQMKKIDIIDVIYEQIELDMPLNLMTPALRILGNFCSGNSQMTQYGIKNGKLFDVAMKTLNHEKKVIRRETCWMLSNVAAGTQVQIGYLLNRKDILTTLLQLLKTDHPNVRKEILYVYENMGLKLSNKSIFQFYKENAVFEALLDKLHEEKDEKILTQCLSIVERVLKAGEQFKDDQQNIFIQKINNSGAVNTLEGLQMHADQTVYEKTAKILQCYFDCQ